jgi:NMD protein affecting ribosome stability and mRNA decay
MRHQHRPTTKRRLDQRNGVPYEVELTVCAHCEKLLAERFLRRAAA